MISSLLIGNKENTELYKNIISKIRYFSSGQVFNTDQGSVKPGSVKDQLKGAVVIAGQIENCFELLKFLIRQNQAVYCVDQPSLQPTELEEILKLSAEAGALLQFEAPELFHPLIQEFINTNRHHLLFRYNKNITSKNHLREVLYNAISFIIVLSPMQVKKIDINSIDTSSNKRPAFKIRLKMFDSSLAYIMLTFESKPEHSIMIEYDLGAFTFDFGNNYLENIHGIRFRSDPADRESLVNKSLEAFAINLILNKNPRFSVYHYTLVSQELRKIEHILRHSF